jgi:hypothetical protein
MTTLLSSDRDHAIDRLNAAANRVDEVTAVESFVTNLIPVHRAWEMVRDCQLLQWIDGRLVLTLRPEPGSIVGQRVEFPEVTER